MERNDNTLDIKSLFFKLLRKWYWFVLGLFVSGILCLFYFLSTTDKFAVNSRIMIRKEKNMGQFSGTEMLSAMGLGSNNKVVDDEIAILTSRDVISQVIQELDIQSEYRVRKGLRWCGQYPNPDFRVHYPEQFLDTMRQKVQIKFSVNKSGYKLKVKYGMFKHSSHRLTTLAEPVQTCIGELRIIPMTELKTGKRYRVYTSPMLPLSTKYNTRVKANKLKKESNVINISTVTDMPEREVDFIKKEIEIYNRSAVEDKNMMASNTAAFIEERLRLIEEELSVSEKQVQEYKQQNHLTDLALETGMYLAESKEYRKRILELETQTNLLEFVREFLQDEKNADKLIPANIGIADEAMVDLIGSYNGGLLSKMRLERSATESNPMLVQMNTELRLTRENILATIRSVLNTIAIAKRDLNTQYGITDKNVDAVPQKEREFVEIKRSQMLKEQLYLLLYQKREENAILLASTVMPARIVDVAKPNPIRVSPKLKMLGLIWLVLGLGFPLLCIYVYDIFNDKIESEDEYKHIVKLPYAGVLVQNHHGGFVAVKDGVNSVSAELFRSLRSNLRFLLPAGTKNPVVVVTSSVSGEGKSYVAANLAISLALLKKKVALVGLDIRKPMMSEYLQLSSSGCLTSYLSDEAYKVDDLIVPYDALPNLHLLPAGAVPPNPGELILSERLDELFAELRKRYDYIIVDSAPVELVGDTFMLSRLADMTLFVSRIKVTTREMLANLHQYAEQKRLKNVACVLNGVKSARAGYGYGL